VLGVVSGQRAVRETVRRVSYGHDGDESMGHLVGCVAWPGHWSMPSLARTTSDHALVGEGHGDADRTHRETRPMALAGDVFPQAEVLGSKAVDGAIGQLDVDLAADHSHPPASRGGMKVSKLGRLIHLEGASRAGLQRLQNGIILAEFLDHARAICPRIHAKDAHLVSSLSSLSHTVVAALGQAAGSSPALPHAG
jgi:hypothetical protein